MASDPDGKDLTVNYPGGSLSLVTLTNSRNGQLATRTALLLVMLSCLSGLALKASGLEELQDPLLPWAPGSKETAETLLASVPNVAPNTALTLKIPNGILQNGSSR